MNAGCPGQKYSELNSTEQGSALSWTRQSALSGAGRTVLDNVYCTAGTKFIFRGTARNISTGFCFALTVSHRLYTTVQY